MGRKYFGPRDVEAVIANNSALNQQELKTALDAEIIAVAPGGGGGGGGANTSLNNLTSTAINMDLIAAGSSNLGSAASPWNTLFTNAIVDVNSLLSIDPNNRVLYSAGEGAWKVLDYQNCLLFPNNQVNAVMNWASQLLQDYNGAISVNWSSRALVANGFVVVDWNGCELIDTIGQNGSLNWNSRQLVSSDGTTVVLDWSANSLALTGQEITISSSDNLSLNCQNNLTLNSNGNTVIFSSGQEIDFQNNVLENVSNIQSASNLNMDVGQVSLGNGSVGSTLNSLVFLDASGSSGYVGFQAPHTVTSSTTWTLPASDGTSGQALVTDGAANLNWTDVPPTPPFYLEYHVQPGYVGTSTGSYAQPYGTIQAAIDAAQSYGAANAAVIIHGQSSTENLVINNYAFNLLITYATGTVIDNQEFILNGNVTISGTSTRIRLKDFKIVSPSGPDLIDSSTGRNYFSNVGFESGNGIQFTGSWGKWHEFTDCTISGPVSIAGTPAAGSTVSFWRVRGGGNYTLNSSNATLQLYDSFSVGNVVQTAGVLQIDGGRNFVAGSTLTSTSNSVSDLMSVTNLSLETGSNTWMQINKTGTCPYILSNVLRNEAGDTLTGTRVNQGATSADASYLPTTPGNWSVVPNNVKQGLDLLAANAGGGGLAPSLYQEVFVAIGGSDVTGNGTYEKPFATITNALASITDAGVTQNGSMKRYAVRVAAGSYDEPQIMLKPYVYVIGSGYESTYIRVNGGAGSVTLDSAAILANANQGGRLGISNCYLGHGTGLNLDLHSIGPNTGSPSADITLQNVLVTGNTTLTGRAPGIDYVEMYDCYFIGDFQGNDLSYGPSQGQTFGGTTTISVINLTQANASGSFQNAAFSGDVAFTNTTVYSVPMQLAACTLAGTLSVSGPIPLTIDVISKPDLAKTSIAGGATLTLTSDSSGLGYTPTAGNWAAAAPTDVFDALERMAALLKTLNGGNPIP